MPLYSDYGVYSSPTSYVSHLLPYANHSSIIASNVRLPSIPKISRPFSRAYKPHLATINESQAISSPLRKQYSPKIHLHAGPKFTMPKPIKINTADIDVSLNKYRKYDRNIRLQRPNESKDNERRSKSKSPSPSESPVKVTMAVEERQEVPNAPIRRDRALVRLRTVHRKNSPDSNEGKKKQRWRENFLPSELVLLGRKSPVEEKTKEVEQNPQGNNNRTRAEKSPSFHDICALITKDSIDEDLNPGQPEDVKRKQSRHVTEEELEQLKVPLECLPKITEQDTQDQMSTKRKKKTSKKRSNEKLLLSDDEEFEVRTNLQRRLTKKYRRTSTDSSFSSDLDPEREQAYQDAIRDISLVEVEEIKIKPKPIITATVDVDEPKKNLKLVVDEVEVVESPKKTEGKKFKYNVSVSEVEEMRRSIKQKTANMLKDQKKEINNNEPIFLDSSKSEEGGEKITERIREEEKFETCKGIVQVPNAEQAVELNLLLDKKTAQCGRVLRSGGVVDGKKVIDKKYIPEEDKAEGAEEDDSNLVALHKTCDNEEIEYKSENNLLDLSRKMERLKTESPAVKLPPKENNKSVENFWALLGKSDSASDFLNLRVKKDENEASGKRTETSEFEVQQYLPPKSENMSSENFWASLATRESVFWENRARQRMEENSRVAIASIKKNYLFTEDQKNKLIQTVNDNKESVDVQNDGNEETVTVRGRVISKRSLINKPNKVEDPDLQVFVPPAPSTPDPEPEQKKQNSSSFVPLQSNRLSAFMNPFKKPEQYEECPVEIYATPKVIRGRHIPRPRHPPPQPVVTTSEESEETSDEEESSEDDSDGNVVSGKIGASTSSNDSGFDSSAHGSPGNKSKG